MTYYECDGEDRRALTVTASIGTQIYTRSWSDTEKNTVQDYKKMTITCNPAPISSGGINVFIAYETARTFDGAGPDNYNDLTLVAEIGQGETSVVIDIPILETQCFY